MSGFLNQVGLFYDDGGYKETPVGAKTQGAPQGLMGRQVAGKEFLDAFLAHGRWKELVGLANNPPSANSLTAYWRSLPPTQTSGRSLRVVGLGNAHRDFFRGPAAPVLHFPNPIELRYAWARQQVGPAGFCFSGITHTICSWRVVQLFCDMVTTPLEPFDTLICISRQAIATIKDLTDTYCDYLRDRFGGDPRLRITLEHIPLGVDTEKYRPARDDERAGARAALRATDDEVVVLFVGRLSFHAKVHPFPIYAGLARAARQTGKRVHLVMAGWAVNQAVMNAFQDGARVFAPNVRVTFVDGTTPQWRYTVWRAADIATSPTDNIQETLSQVVLEGSACGLPVVVTNWDGCKDQVIDGETGFLVPAYMVRDATPDLTSRLILGETDYDHFLAECNQTVAVDVEAAAQAYSRLILDPALRRRMGEAGRKRVLDKFTWAGVVRAYEELWARQDADRCAFVARHADAKPAYPVPAYYPAPDRSFASYPTTILEGGAIVKSTDGAQDRLGVLLHHTLTNYVPNGRADSPSVLAAVLQAAERPLSIEEIDAVFARHELPGEARATIAWMLKYDLLRVMPS